MDEYFVNNPYGDEQNVPKLIVIHAMGEYIENDDGQVYTAVDWLIKLKLSAHKLITPSGVSINLCCIFWRAMLPADHHEGL